MFFEDDPWEAGFSDDVGHILVGYTTVVVARVMTGGLEMRVLEGADALVVRLRVWFAPSLLCVSTR